MQPSPTKLPQLQFDCIKHGVWEVGKAIEIGLKLLSKDHLPDENQEFWLTIQPNCYFSYFERFQFSAPINDYQIIPLSVLPVASLDNLAQKLELRIFRVHGFELCSTIDWQLS